MEGRKLPTSINPNPNAQLKVIQPVPQPSMLPPEVVGQVNVAVKAFEDSLTEVQHFQGRTAGIILGTLIALGKTSGDAMSMLVAGGLGYAAEAYGHPAAFGPKKELNEKQQIQLKTLTQMYTWILYKGRAAVTHDHVFLKLLNILSPYVWDKTLCPDDFRTPEFFKSCSPEYRQILSSDPHRVIIPEVRDTLIEQADAKNEAGKKDGKDSSAKSTYTLLGWIFGVKEAAPAKESNKAEVAEQKSVTNETMLAANQAKPADATQAKKKEYNKPTGGERAYSMFSYPLAQIRRLCYGFGSEEDSEAVAEVTRVQFRKKK